MKITIEHYGIEHSMSNLPDEIDIFELSRFLRQILLAIGFQDKTVDEILDKQ